MSTTKIKKQSELEISDTDAVSNISDDTDVMMTPEEQADYDKQVLGQQMMREVMSDMFELQVDAEGNKINMIQALFMLFKSHFESTNKDGTTINLVDAINRNTKAIVQLTKHVETLASK